MTIFRITLDLGLKFADKYTALLCKSVSQSTSLRFMNKYFTLLLWLYAIAAHAQSKSGSPFRKQEFRAVWIATVDNIDWPQKGQFDSEEQQKDFIRILDEHKRSNMNAVMVQVRTACDAYYAKGAEPWSEFLTGLQGKFPSPYYDPMPFMIKEAHDRNMEFHAWLNLNRVTFKGNRRIMSEHISVLHPEWMLTYDGQKIMNFGIPAVRDYLVQIVEDILTHYDIDGIHFDDYFYPYPITGQVLADEATFEEYNRGFNNIEDWRRDNTDLLIEAISQKIMSLKPRVKFGISPFGVWQNYSNKDKTGSKTQAGITSYYSLYADVRKWLENGWIDYVAPQIYFERSHTKAPYKVLVDWWAKNTFGKHLYIGHGLYKLKSWPADELPYQLRIDRANGRVQGGMFFSSKWLTENQNGVQDSLRNHYYKYPALVPTMPWKDQSPPMPPQNGSISQTSEGVNLAWVAGTTADDGDENYYFVVYRFDAKEEIDLRKAEKILYIGKEKTFIDTSPKQGYSYVYVVTAFDRQHNESHPLVFEMQE